VPGCVASDRAGHLTANLHSRPSGSRPLRATRTSESEMARVTQHTHSTHTDIHMCTYTATWPRRGSHTRARVPQRGVARPRPPHPQPPARPPDPDTRRLPDPHSRCRRRAAGGCGLEAAAAAPQTFPPKAHHARGLPTPAEYRAAARARRRQGHVEGCGARPPPPLPTPIPTRARA
jgi:hypothetical protein